MVDLTGEDSSDLVPSAFFGDGRPKQRESQAQNVDGHPSVQMPVLPKMHFFIKSQSNGGKGARNKGMMGCHNVIANRA